MIRLSSWNCLARAYSPQLVAQPPKGLGQARRGIETAKQGETILQTGLGLFCLALCQQKCSQEAERAGFGFLIVQRMGQGEAGLLVVVSLPQLAQLEIGLAQSVEQRHPQTRGFVGLLWRL